MRPRLSPGDEVDGFRLEELLHVGGMAEIWRAARDDEPAPVALKVPLVRDSDDPTPIVSFEVEQMILPCLAGPHVPRFIRQGDFSMQPYIAMELIGGPSLKPLIDALPLAPDEVARLGAKVARALHDIHRQHVIHLDVKPSNIMLRPSGEAVLVDFGLARHAHLPDLLAEEFHLPLGTAPYMSPEQVLEGRGDPRSDLFALGVMLYFFATGERPFGIPHGRRGLRRRLWRDPKPPRAVNPRVPPWLQEVILRCLEVDPARRHPSAAQLAFDLENPDQVALTDRAERRQQDSLRAVLRRRAKAPRTAPVPERSIPDQLAHALIVLAGIDLSPERMDLADEQRRVVGRILAIEPRARLACVSVLQTSRIGVDVLEDREGRNLHIQRLVELKDWARPLGLAGDRVTYTVLEAADPAAALVDYARHNAVDHIVLGARASSALRRYLGSVSAKVVAEAPCSVTVVRLPASGRDAGAEPPAVDARGS
jgi:serine/threonine protein kinase